MGMLIGTLASAVRCGTELSVTWNPSPQFPDSSMVPPRVRVAPFTVTLSPVG
jgi:hypothetical protein